MQNFKAQLETLLFRVYLTIWTINICPLTILCKGLLNIIIGGKGAISNINYYRIIIVIIIILDLAAALKEKFRTIEKLETALERQQDGEYTS